MKIKNIFMNVITSGKYTSQNDSGISDYYTRYILMNFIIFFGTILLVVFTVNNISRGAYFDAISCGTMAVIAILTFFLARTKVKQIVPVSIMMIFYGLFCSLLTWYGDAQGAGVQFIYVYPILTTMMLGMKSGIILSASLIVIVSLEMLVPGLSYHAYHIDISSRIIASYLLVFFVTFVMENTRNRKDRMIEEQNRRLQELKEDAEAANRTKSSFLASMSHEIRTPMNAITGMAELILRSEFVDESRVYAQDIKHAGNNLISIINDILDISKIEAGKMEIVPVNYFLKSLLGDTVNIINTRLAEKPIQFFTDVDPSIPNGLTGDEARIRQILLNLLSNAVKYTDKGNISLSVSKENTEEKDENQVWIKIVVRDTGKGIKPEDQAKLFNKFTQVDIKTNIGIEGTGLGLAITKQLCELMGGSICVESEYGKGSTFSVIIPQGIHSNEPFGAMEIISNNQNEKTPSVNCTFPNARILLVDDLPVNLKVAEGLLEPYKTRVDSCQSGEEAIAFVKKNKYDIVFMDHMMPGMDGIEATARIREFNTNIPIIALTANAVVGMKEKFIDNGFNDFISKPIDVSKLDEILKNWITNTNTGLPEPSAVKKEYSEPKETNKNEKKNIVLVDDSVANLQAGKNALQEKYRVATVPSAEKLFKLLEKNIPALILLDVEMPQMNGYEAIKVLKSKPETRDIPVIFLTGLSDSDDELEGLTLGAVDYITKPFQPALLLKRIELHLLLNEQNHKLEKQTIELLNFNENLQKMVVERTQSIVELQEAMLKTIAELVECRDDITGGHIERTQKGIKILFDELKKRGLYIDEIKKLNEDLMLQSCQLHDVGKISITDNILKKPGKLDENEFAEMKKHTVFGEQIIERIESLTKESEFLKYAKIFTVTHHEKWNGDGYPRKLKGEEIPLLGRLMAIADVYDALVSERPYKNAFSHEEAVKIITEGSGTHFDPTLVEVFLDIHEQFACPNFT